MADDTIRYGAAARRPTEPADAPVGSSDVNMRVRDVLRRHEKLKNDRGNWNSQWQEIAERIWPERSSFGVQRSGGEKLQQKIFDSTGVEALRKHASVMESLIVPSTQKWHTLLTSDDDLNDSPSVKLWLEKVRDELFAKRYRPKARFQPNINLCFKEIGAFGNGVIFVDSDQAARGFSYIACDLSRCWFLQKFNGEIDTMHREFATTPRMLAVQFKEYGELPPKLKVRHDKNPDEKLTGLHCVRPSDEMTSLQGLYRKPFSAWYICVETEEMLGREGGYSTMPYAVGRDDMAAGEVYGRGIGGRVLPDIKTLNEAMKTWLRLAHRASAPPLLTAEDGILSVNLQPNAVNRGTMTADGKPLVMELTTGARFEINQETILDLRKKINTAFGIDVFQVLVEDRTQMTATEIMVRLQEKGQLLGPSAAKLQADILGTLVERELAILSENGAFLPGSWLEPPEELQGVDIKPSYSAPVNQMMKTPEGVALDQFMNRQLTMAAQDPSVLDFTDNDKVLGVYADVLGVPQKVQRTPDEIAQLRAARQQQNMAAQAVQAAPLAASAAKDLATAQATQAATGTPGTTLPVPAA